MLMSHNRMLDRRDIYYSSNLNWFNQGFLYIYQFSLSIARLNQFNV